MAIDVSIDTFTRGNQSGWGTASDSETYTAVTGSYAGGGSTFSIATNRGVAGTNTGTNLQQIGKGSLRTGDWVMRFAMSATNDLAGFFFRFANGTNYMRCEVGNNTLRMRTIVGGSLTTLTSTGGTGAPTITANTNYWVHLNVPDATSFNIRVWADGGSEPGTWNGQYSSSNITTRGTFGILAACTTAGDTVSVDSFSVTTNPSTYYVATTGNDSNIGSSGSPWLTLDHADTIVCAGDTVNVLSGTYTETANYSLVTATHGTLLAHITYQSTTQWGALIRTSGVEQAWQQDGDCIDVIGFDISNSNTPGTPTMNVCAIFVLGSHCRTAQCHIHDVVGAANSNGLAGISNSLYSVGNVTEDNLIHDIAWANTRTGLNTGIYYSQGPGTCQNNIIYRCSGWGSNLGHHAQHITYSHNLVFQCLWGGVVICADTGYVNDYTIIANNIFYDIPCAAGSNTIINDCITVPAVVGANNQYLNNAIYGAVTANQMAPGHSLVGTISSDPLFTNYQADGSGDYSLLLTSPCIAAGTSTGAATADYNGHARPHNGNYDVGPWQYAFSLFGATTSLFNAGRPRNVPATTALWATWRVVPATGTLWVITPGLSATIGSTVTFPLIEYQPITLTEGIGVRGTCRFAVADSSGTLVLEENMPVSVNDGATNLFTGYIDVVEVAPNTNPNSAVTFYTVRCKDKRYLTDKRIWSGDEFVNMRAGDIACTVHDLILADEGVTAGYAQDFDHDITTWTEGTHTSTSGATGALTLAASGTSASFTYPDTTAFTESSAVFTNTVMDGSQMSLNHGTIYTRDWTDNTTTNQTAYSASTNTGNHSMTSTRTQSASGGQYLITLSHPARTDLANAENIDTLSFLESRLDTPASTSAFILEVDVSINITGLSWVNYPYAVGYWSNVGILYFTTHWGAEWNSFGYYVGLDYKNQKVIFGVGSNSTTDSYTEITTSSQTILVNTLYHVKIMVTGGRHRIYFNNGTTPIINVTHTTYTSGQFGFRCFDWIYVQGPLSGTGGVTSGSTVAKYDNLSITPYPQPGTWQSASHSISAVGTVGNSRITWTPSDSSPDPINTHVVKVSLDAGSTWQMCTKDAVIPGCAPGTNVTGKSLLIQVTLGTTDLTQLPLFTYLHWEVVQAYAASGNRISATLAIPSLTYIGATSISWDATTPTDTTLLVQTSLDNGSTWQDASSGQVIPGITDKPLPFSDTYETDTMGNYTHTYADGGSPTLMTITPTASRVDLVGGTNALCAWVGVNFTDGDVYAVISRSDAGGLLLRYQDSDNWYSVRVADSGASTNPQKLWVVKRVGGTNTQIVAPVTIDFVRDAYHSLHCSITGSLITCFWDGVQVAQVVDTDITLIGQTGYWNGTGTATWYLLNVTPHGEAIAAKQIKTKVSMTTSDTTVTPTVRSLVLTVRGDDIDTGVLVTSTHYQYRYTLSRILDDLAGRSSMWWDITDAGHFLLSDLEATPAPWPISTAHGDALLNRQPVVKKNSPLYRNRQYITGAIDTVTQHETQKGNGHTQSWNLAYKVYDAPTILLNSVPVTVGIQGVDAYRDYYYSKGSTTIAQDVNGVILVDTDILDITYLGGVDYTAMAENSDQQAILAAIDGSTGIVEATEDCNGLLKDDAIALAQDRIKQYAKLTQVWSFSLAKYGLALGHLLTVFAPEHGLNGKEFFVQSLSTTIKQRANGDRLYLCDVEAVDGAITGSWHNFFIAFT